LVRLPIDEAELLERTLERAPAVRDPDDEDYTAAWIALADLFHRYGLRHPTVSQAAEHIVETGADIEASRDLGMDDADLRRRSRAIERAAVRWRTPHPRPRRRRVMDAPEPLLFDSGRCLAYPTLRGNAADASWTHARLRAEFEPDGWGCFVVLAATRRYGYYASYLVARLALETAECPTSAEILGSVISGIRSGMIGIPPDPAVKVVHATTLETRKLGLREITSCDLAEGALRSEFADRYALLDRPYWSLVGLLRPYGDAHLGWAERPVAMKGLPWRRFVSGDSGCG
jgi:hypothetical protein